jgi:hypothetical protein
MMMNNGKEQIMELKGMWLLLYFMKTDQLICQLAKEDAEKNPEQVKKSPKNKKQEGKIIIQMV